MIIMKVVITRNIFSVNVIATVKYLRQNLFRAEVAFLNWSPHIISWNYFKKGRGFKLHIMLKLIRKGLLWFYKRKEMIRSSCCTKIKYLGTYFQICKKKSRGMTSGSCHVQEIGKQKNTFIVEYSVASHPSWMDLGMDSESQRDRATVWSMEQMESP